MNSSGENVAGQELEALSPRENNEEEVLSDGQVYLSIYEGVSIQKKSFLSNEKWQEWNIQTNHMQEWYIRCSWINKFLFLEALCKATTGCLVIGSVLKCIQSIIAKDVVESLSGFHREFAFDGVPRDDDRSLPVSHLKQVMKKHFLWFHSQQPMRQVAVILKLLRLSGGSLIFAIYKSLVSFYTERQIEWRRASVGSAAENGPKGMNDGKNSLVDIKKPKDESQMKLVEKFRSSISKQHLASDTQVAENLNKNIVSEFSKKKCEALTRREVELSGYKREKGIINGYETSKTSKKAGGGGEAKESVDYLQILPIYLNRRIMSYVDEKTLSGLKKVGKYWGKMIDESINEKSGRRAINAKINKIIGTKPERREERCREWETGEDDKKENDQRQRSKDDELVEAEKSMKKDFFKRNNLSENNVCNTTKFYEKVFSKKHGTMKLDKSAFYDRCCCWNEKVNVIACSTPSNVIYFYSVRTGARLNFSVSGFDTTVTCLSFYSSGHYIIVGCKDGILLSKVARTNKKNAQFYGHFGAIKSLYTTDSHLLSLSSENIIRYHQFWSGICLLCIDLSQEFNVSCLLLTKESPLYRSAIGTKEGILILVDVKSKKFTRKANIQCGEIKALAQTGAILITAASSGKILIWDIAQLETNVTTPNPCYEFHVAACISSLFLHRNQIVVGCQNGTVKIVSLTEGKRLKSLKTSGQVSVLGLAVAEDRFTFKVIVWHEEGLEMRIFSLVKLPRRSSSRNGKSIKKNNRECKQSAPHEAEKIKFSKLVSTESAVVAVVGGGSGDCGGGNSDPNGREVIEVIPNA